MSGLTSSGVSVEGQGPRLKAEMREVDRDIEDARERVRMMDRAQWGQVSYMRRGETGRTVAIVAVIATMKKKVQKGLSRLQAHKQQLLKDIDLEKRWAEHREEEKRRREELLKDRLARSGEQRERQEGRQRETEQAREDERQRVERSRQRAEAAERRRGLRRDDEDNDHEPDIGF